jgi:hypothetical protein
MDNSHPLVGDFFFRLRNFPQKKSRCLLILYTNFLFSFQLGWLRGRAVDADVQHSDSRFYVVYFLAPRARKGVLFLPLIHRLQVDGADVFGVSFRICSRRFVTFSVPFFFTHNPPCTTNVCHLSLVSMV